MSAVMKSWEAHCAHPRLPRSMAFRLVNAGFRLDGAAVFPILKLQYTDDTYSKALAQLIRNFVGNRKNDSSDDLIAWHAELEQLAKSWVYFFSSKLYIFEASKNTS